MASLSPSPQLSITFPNGIYKPIPDKILSHLQMASISPSSYPPSLQMASVSPFPTSHCWYSTMRVQISGHSSVQSSSTFGSRKARKPIYILRSKKIEQGQLLYPKICPPIFFKVLTSIISICSSLLKDYTVKHPPKPVKLGFWFLQGSWGFQGLNQVPYAHIHCQALTCQVSRLTRSSCTVKNPNCLTINCRGKMVIWQSKVKIFGQHLILKPQSSFGQILTMISQEWLKNHQDAKVSIFGQLKSHL